ncbi:MAG TPA: DNA-processing protein DprA [Patescibacteria group bacterium]|nr:DNA-processing protein DprA [Patescibacteria group bacterium]
MVDKDYLILLSTFINFGPARIKLLTGYFKGAKNVWSASKKDLSDVGLRKSLADNFLQHRNKLDPDLFFSNLKKKQINIVVQSGELYPANLKGLDDAPVVLYYKGILSKNDVNSVAIVGARKMTSYGREVTSKFALELAAMGIPIVSGLAFGVDVEAHRSAVSIGGRCIAVLASGVDTITPRSNEWLGRKIIEERGVILSEYPPGTVPQRNFFPYRNRIISGIARVVIVVEGLEKSGTLHTASHAASQGKTVFAVPGQITSPTSGAPHFLLKNGAKMATCVKDILDDMDLQVKVDRDAVAKIMPDSEDEVKILKFLEVEPLFLDELVRISGVDVKIISAKLTMMEMKGLVKNLGGGKYKKV